MKIENNAVATFDYTLKDEAGKVLDTSDGREPLSYLHGAGNIIPGLENELQGHEAGDSFTTEIGPEDAYGEYSDEMVFSVTKDKFQNPEQIEEGIRFQAEINGEPRICTVAGVEGESVEVDANHPLAGMNLHFDVTVREVREATAEELEHGHVHTDDNDNEE